MTTKVKFPTELPNVAPDSNDRILFSDTSNGNAAADCAISELPVSTATQAAIDVVQADIDAHEARTDNPHTVTKSQVGLGNVDNTSDANKPISTATQVALDTKLESVVAGTNITIDNTDPLNPVISAAGGSGTGDMTKAVYDPANIGEQLVGLTATQFLQNKILRSGVIQTNVSIVDNATEQKEFNFDNSLLTPLTPRTLKVPDNSGVIVLSDDDGNIPANSITTSAIKITGGTPGVGKVLTSDADGDATWETPAASSGKSISLDYYNGGTIAAGVILQKPVNAMTLNDVIISLETLPVGGDFQIDVKKNGTSVLSGVLTITTTESAKNSLYYTKTGASGKATISTSSFAAGDRLTVEVSAGSGNTFLGAGLTCQLIGTLS